MFLEQLTLSDNTTLLDWTHISTRIKYLPTSRKPKQFSTLENTILIDSSTCAISNQIILSNINSLSLSTGHFKNKPSPWLLTYNDDNIIIGKAYHYNYSTNSVSITYWQTNIDLSITSLYLTPSISCYPCPGCNLNSLRIANHHTFNISATFSTKFLVERNMTTHLTN